MHTCFSLNRAIAIRIIGIIVDNETKVELAILGIAGAVAVLYVASKNDMLKMPTPPSDGGNGGSKGGKVIEITGAQLDSTIRNEKRLVVDAYTPPCGPCAALAPVLEKLAGETGVTVARMDVSVASSNNILQSVSHFDGVPTLFYYSKGKLIEVATGAPYELDLKKKMERL